MWQVPYADQRGTYDYYMCICSIRGSVCVSQSMGFAVRSPQTFIEHHASSSHRLVLLAFLLGDCHVDDL